MAIFSFLRAMLGIPRTSIAFLTARRVAVEGWSMAPTLRPGERLLFHRLAYSRGRPRKGDIVLAEHPSKRGFLLVKRVAAVPGERVEALDGKLLVENEPWKPPGEPSIISFDDDRCWALKEGEYFLMGDTPSRSTDSRQLGPFPRRLIRARAWLVYWPPSRWRVLHPLVE